MTDVVRPVVRPSLFVKSTPVVNLDRRKKNKRTVLLSTKLQINLKVDRKGLLSHFTLGNLVHS